MTSLFLPRPPGLPSASPSSLSCIRRQPEISCLYNPRNYHPVNVNHNERVTVAKLKQKKQDRIPITVVTAYDYPSAVHVSQAGIDVCLVSDSASILVHGYDTNLEITLEEMLIHCRAVSRGATHPLLVGDLPFGTYEMSTHQAVETAVRVLKEGGMDAVKLDGGSPLRIDAAKDIVGAGIAVMGCVRLKTQGCVDSAIEVMETAISLQNAGCFSVVLECMPAPLAAAITDKLEIPTIGFISGRYCSGQVLLYHDLLGVSQSTVNAKVVPKFCKQYGNVGRAINKALLKYKEDVTEKKFPCSDYTPYSIDIGKLSRKLKSKKYSAEAQVAEQKEAELKKEKAIKLKEMEEKKNNIHIVNRD